jgi:rRNA maturation RNase YbeY
MTTLKVTTNKKKYEPLLFETVSAALSFFREPDGLEVGIRFLGDTDMRELNRATRGVDSVTDVLSFPMLSLKAGEPIKKERYASDIDGSTGLLYLGDIALSEKKIRSQAAENGNDFSEELRYLALHGVLHLLGFDHETPEDKLEMRTAEKSVLEIFGKR